MENMLVYILPFFCEYQYDTGDEVSDNLQYASDNDSFVRCGTYKPECLIPIL